MDQGGDTAFGALGGPSPLQDQALQPITTIFAGVEPVNVSTQCPALRRSQVKDNLRAEWLAIQPRTYTFTSPQQIPLFQRTTTGNIDPFILDQMQQPPSTRTFMAPHQASHPVPQDQEIRPSTPASLSNMANFDPDRIFRWCHTATTIDQSLLLSPLTPRPFTDAELGFKYMDRSTSSSSLEMPYRVSDTHSPQEGPEKLYPIGPPTPMGSMDAPAFVPLAAMYRAQEQVRCGVDLPPLMVPEVYREGGKVVGGPRLIASGLEKIDGDLIKKPKPSQCIEHAILNARTEPQHLFTTQGLVATLAKIFGPAHIPDDVLVALPNPPSSPLMDSGDPPPMNGNAAQHVCALTRKDMDYLASYITTLISRLNTTTATLEEELEDAEVDKAALQVQVNRFMVTTQAAECKVQRLQELVRYLSGMVEEGKRGEATKVVREAFE